MIYIHNSTLYNSSKLTTDVATCAFPKCLSNPNVLTVKTKFGGHLGWQEAPQKGTFGIGRSWADNAMADFIQAVLDVRLSDKAHKDVMENEGLHEDRAIDAAGIVEDMYGSRKLRSKL